MEHFGIIVSQDNGIKAYRIVNNESDRCEFEVYLNKTLMAVFEPDESEYIHICRNPGGLGEEVIVQIADRIEAHYL